jgi:hypothetical protein
VEGHGGTSDLTQYAAEIAPLLDRARLAVVAFLRTKADEVAQHYAITAPALQTLGMLRNTLPDRDAAIDDVLELFIYSKPDQIRSNIEELITGDVLVSIGDDRVLVTHRGREIVHTMFGLTQQFIDGLWEAHADLVARLLPIADRACAAVTTTGGAAVRVVAPVYDSPGASPALMLAERQTPLRFHRFDAHVEAWRSEGLTVQEIQALDSGPQHERIELATNRWAAAPYCGLDPAERLELLRGLESLPA